MRPRQSAGSRESPPRRRSPAHCGNGDHAGRSRQEMTDTVLGIDAGTSGCRVAAYDPALREVAAATARYQVSLPGPGRAEIDADEVWAAVAGCLRTVNEQLDRSPQALAIAVQGETVLPAGADGEALAMAP